MTRSLFGMEVEVAASAVSPDGHFVPGDSTASTLLGHARNRYPCLPARGKGGVFLQNGMLMYIDTGYHLECCSPECSDPAEVVRYLKAAEQILLDLAHMAVTGNPEAMKEIMFHRGNVSYANGTTWGCHESYFHTSDPAALPRQLLPHFASRILYAGAGGFLPHTNEIVFTLSPRVAFMTGAISGSSTESRGIYHTKNEPLCRHGNRLHVLCGESNSSDLTNYLKIGTTALIMAAVDHGAQFADEVALADDLMAMRTFAADPDCVATAPRFDGRPLRAVDIQRHYLARVEQYVDRPGMPSWAGDVCLRWREVLDLIEEDPRLLAGRIDWAIKRTVYDSWLKTAGYDWKSIEVWNSVQAQLRHAALVKGMRRTELDRNAILGPGSLLNTEVQRLGPRLVDAGMSWSDIELVKHLRDRLREIDTRFGLYGPEGIFNGLDAEGLLSHRVPGCEAFPDPVGAIPSSDRAHLRSRAIRMLHANNIRFRCDWLGVYDWTGDILLDLSDPFACDESALNSFDERGRLGRSSGGGSGESQREGRRFWDPFIGDPLAHGRLPTPEAPLRFRQRICRSTITRSDIAERNLPVLRMGDTVRLLAPAQCPNHEGQDVKPEDYSDNLPGRIGRIAGCCDLDCGRRLAVPVIVDGHYLRWRLRDLEKIAGEVQSLCG